MFNKLTPPHILAGLIITALVSIFIQPEVGMVAAVVAGIAKEFWVAQRGGEANAADAVAVVVGGFASYVVIDFLL